MTEKNTEGPDNVHEGPRLSPATEPGVQKLGLDGQLIPAVPKPAEQNPTDIETLKSMYELETNVTLKTQAWFRIQDHEAQQVIRDDRTPFDRLQELPAFQAVQGFQSQVQVWMKDEALRVRDAEEDPNLSEEGVRQRLDEMRLKRAAQAQDATPLQLTL